MSIVSYLKETKGEMSHVNWPTRSQSITFTVIVIVVSLVISIILGFFDLVFSKILNLFI